MQGSFISRSACSVAIILVLTASTLAGASVSAQGPGGDILCQGVACTVGLAMDKRGNLYMAEKKSGYVFCVPPSSTPVLLAKVPGTPTVLAIDRVQTLFVGTEGGQVFSVSLDGSVEEVFRCDGRPVGIEIDRDGGLVIATENGKVVRVERTLFLSRR